MKIPLAVIDRQQALIGICNDNPISIPVPVAADFLGMDVACLRESIDQGKCRFGLGGRNGLKGNRFCKIPTLAFFNWVTMGTFLEGADNDV